MNYKYLGSVNKFGTLMKEIPGCPNYYITTKGDVYSRCMENYMKSGLNANGYVQTRVIDKNGKKYTIRNHREVAKAFIDNPNNLPQVNHIDEDKNNNNVSNLEWCTNLYNSRYGTRGKRIGEAIYNSGRPIVALDEEGNIVKRYANQMRVENDGYRQSNVNKVLHKKRKTAYGMRFEWEDEYELSQHNT